jgi:hypothetical protein
MGRRSFISTLEGLEGGGWKSCATKLRKVAFSKESCSTAAALVALSHSL